MIMPTVKIACDDSGMRVNGPLEEKIMSNNSFLESLLLSRKVNPVGLQTTASMVLPIGKGMPDKASLGVVSLKICTSSAFLAIRKVIKETRYSATSIIQTPLSTD